MPRNQEDYDLRYYEDDEVEHDYDWYPYSERLRHAEFHVESFERTVESGYHDLMVGPRAQGELEHGMKALLHALGAKLRKPHNIGELLGNIRYNDPEMQDFQLSIPPNVYTEYVGGNEYYPREEPELSSFPDYLERTIADAQAILARAKQVREQKEEQETP